MPSLLDGAGELFTPGQVPELLAQARIDEVAREFRAQLDAGLTPTHLDWHCLADGGREDVFDLTVALAREHGLAVRTWLAPGRRKLRARGLPVTDHEFLDSFSLPLDTKPARYAGLLRALPPGLTEWAVHPALATEEARATDPGGWRVRHTDHAFLTSPASRALLRAEGITVTGYGLLQHAWSRPAVPP